MLLYIAKCSVFVRKVLLKQLQKLILFIFVGLWRFPTHVKFAFHHLLEFAPEVKQVRALTYISFVSWMKVLGRIFKTDQFSPGMITY